MSRPDEMTLMGSLRQRGAVKSYLREPSGVIAETQYQLQKLWLAWPMTITCFDGMADLLAWLVEEQNTMLVRGAPKPGIDTSKPILRRIHGDTATLMDVPRRWLHLDIDRLAAPHIDVVGDPSGAIDYAVDAVATAAPELEGASCFAAFSSKAGVFNSTAVKLHVWYWLDRHYSTAELKRWGSAVNERAGFGLIDLALFNAAQANYTARPVFGPGVIDPLPGNRRWAVRRGYEDTPSLVIPEPAKYRASPAVTGGTVRSAPTGGTVQTAPTGGWKSYLERIDGTGEFGLRRPAMGAMASRVAELGADHAEAERDDIIATVAARLEVAPAGDRPASTVAAYVADLPRQFEWIIERQRESERDATAATPTHAYEGTPIARAAAAVTDAVAAFMETGGVHALKVSTGVGKTDAVLKALAARPHLRAAMMVPRHKLTDELLKRAAALGIRAAAWRGRDARNPDADDGSTMCIEPEVLEAAKKADLVDEACKVCPSRPRCPYFIANDRKPARLEVVANNFLFRKPPALVAGNRNKIDVLILDEAFIDKRVDDQRTLLLDAIEEPFLQRALRAAYAEGQLLRRHLTDAFIDEDACRVGAADVWRQKPKAPKLPGDGAADLAEVLRKYAGRFDSRPALLWRAVGEFLAAAADEDAQAGAVELVKVTTAEGDAPVVRFTIRRSVHETWHGVPTLVLDAETMPSDAELEGLFGRKPSRVEVAAEVPAAVTVRQLVSPLPISALVDREGAAKPKLADVADRVEVLARQYAGQGRDGVDVLAVGGTVAIADRLREALEQRGIDVAPKGSPQRRHAVEVRHCGDLAGEDRYGGVRALVQVGWSLPPTPALERAVGGVTGLMPGRLLGSAWSMARGGLRLRDGSGYRVERPVHPDPAVEELRRRKTEGEMAQALGRARWSRRDAKTPLDVWVLSPLPVPGLVVDRVLRWAEVAVPRAEVAFWRLGGVLPCRPADLVLTRLWPSKAAVREDLKGEVPFRETILKGTSPFKPAQVRYRRVNQRRWSVALVAPWLAFESVAARLRAAAGDGCLIVEAPPEAEIPKPAFVPDDLYRRDKPLHRPQTVFWGSEGAPRLPATLGGAGLSTFPAAVFNQRWHGSLIAGFC